jgi:hypothetical protein
VRPRSARLLSYLSRATHSRRESVHSTFHGELNQRHLGGIAKTSEAADTGFMRQVQVKWESLNVGWLLLPHLERKEQERSAWQGHR